MNERIVEIYKQATGKDWAYDFDPAFVEIFTELLISAVLTEVRDEVQYCTNWETADLVSARVREKFGV